jgi:hypothetical protein
LELSFLPLALDAPSSMSASPLSALWHSFVEYPWQVAAEDLEGLVKAYPDRVEDATESVKAFYFSSFQVPCIAV